jgi:ArsR family transcriptional regulator
VRLTAARPALSYQPVLISAEVDVIQLLSDPLRLRLVELLADGPLCTCHLVEQTGAKQPTVSHHLRLLRQAGAVSTEPHGRFTYYRLDPAVLARAVAGLTGLAERAAANIDAPVRRACP